MTTNTQTIEAALRAAISRYEQMRIIHGEAFKFEFSKVASEIAAALVPVGEYEPRTTEVGGWIQRVR